MKFIPFDDKVVIEPIEKKGVIDTGEDRYLECGKVTAVGEFVDFLKVGDIVFFDAWGHAKTKDADGKTYHIISCNEEVIFGKYAAKK